MSLPISPTKLRELRERKGWYQQDLADACAAAGFDLTQWQISRYERGANTPTPRTLKALTTVFGVSVDDLLDTDSATTREAGAQ